MKALDSIENIGNQNPYLCGGKALQHKLYERLNDLRIQRDLKAVLKLYTEDGILLIK